MEDNVQHTNAGTAPPQEAEDITRSVPRRSTAAARPTVQIGVGALIVALLLCGIVGGLVSRVLLAPVAAAPIGGGLAVYNNVQPAAGSSAALQTDLVGIVQSVGPAVVSIQSEQGLGSGVIYDASGLVLTNAHVVADARRITVALQDGRHLTANVLGSDTGFDLAVLKISGQNLPTAPLGVSSALQAGQVVIAIGNPFGLDHTVTSGVVSAVNRPMSEGQGSYNQPMVQTDAAINPGNSGGPLVDLNGNVVGITTLIATPQGFPAQGLGFAVPVDTAKRIAPQLAQSGHVTHSGQPFLGISLSDLGQRGSGSNRVPGRSPSGATAATGIDHGALVGQVSAGAAAAGSGVQIGDVITSFDGRDIYGVDELLQNLVLHQPNDRVSLTVVRNGQTMDITITIGEAPVL